MYNYKSEAMKLKFLLFLVLILLRMPIHALETNNVFGMKKLSNDEDYQQYVGETFQFRKAIGSIERWDQSGINPTNDMCNRIYTISKITINNVKLNREPNKEILIEAVEFMGNSKVEFKAYTEYSPKISIGWISPVVKGNTLVGYIPIVFTKPFQDFQKKHIGEVIEHRLVKDKYEIIDVFIGRPMSEKIFAGELMAIVRNQRTGEEFVYPYSSVRKDVFKTALKGYYNEKLVMVEKPSDISDRYSKITEETTDSVRKYTYNDSVLSVSMFSLLDDFYLSVTNKSKTSLRIIWDEASFTNHNGISSKILHGGLRYIKRHEEQPSSSTIIRGATLTDIFVPSNNCSYNEDLGEWIVKPVFPKEFIEETLEMSIMLPIRIKNTINEYLLIFKLDFVFENENMLHMDKVQYNKDLNYLK